MDSASLKVFLMDKFSYLRVGTWLLHALCEWRQKAIVELTRYLDHASYSGPILEIAAPQDSSIQTQSLDGLWVPVQQLPLAARHV